MESLQNSLNSLVNAANTAVKNGIKTDVAVTMDDAVYYKLFATLVLSALFILAAGKAVSMIKK